MNALRAVLNRTALMPSPLDTRSVGEYLTVGPVVHHAHL